MASTNVIRYQKQSVRQAAALRVLLAGLSLVLLCLGLSCKSSSEGSPPAHSSRRGDNAAGQLVPVVAVPAVIGDINVYLTGIGSVVPLRTVTVKTQVDGQLQQVLFKEGQRVQSGTLLAVVDPRPFEAQIMQAEGALVRDTALLANARIDLKRYEVLSKGGRDPGAAALNPAGSRGASMRAWRSWIRANLDNARLPAHLLPHHVAGDRHRGPASLSIRAISFMQRMQTAL